MAAYDGDDWCGDGGLWRSNEGSMRRETLGKRKKKMKKEKRQRRTGREMLLDGTSHMGGSHYLLNFIKMPLKLDSQKLKIPICCFLFPSL